MRQFTFGLMAAACLAALTSAAAADKLHEILALRPDVEALLCTGEFIAAGALFEAQRLGIKVPQDLAIAGFEAVELAENVNPTITTVWVPRYDIGARAGAMLLERIAGRPVAERVVDMGYRILKRESTGSARPPSPSRPRIPS